MLEEIAPQVHVDVERARIDEGEAGWPKRPGGEITATRRGPGLARLKGLGHALQRKFDFTQQLGWVVASQGECIGGLGAVLIGSESILRQGFERDALRQSGLQS